MKTTFLTGAWLITSFCFSLSLQAQLRTVRGMVTTFDSIPLINAEIKVQSTKETVLTDTLGGFSVTCNSKDQLKIGASGFYTQKVNLNDKIRFAAVNLKIKPGEKNLEHAIGYGHISERDKINAVESMREEDINISHQYKDIYEMIQGRFAGVQVVGNEIIIRGTNSLMLSSAALIVVDGVPVGSSILQSITPDQVKNISILKDASASVYGSRGANGVVIIETKKGGDQ